MRAHSAAYRSQCKWKMGYSVRRRQILRTALTRDAAPWGSHRECNVCQARGRVPSTCEGVKVKMRESGRANKAETRKKPVGQEVGERAGRARRGHSREHLPANRSQTHACTAGSVGPSRACTSRSSQSEQRTVSQFRFAPSRSPRAHHTTHQRVSRDREFRSPRSVTGLDESYLSEHLSSNITLTLNSCNVRPIS